ncbi:MAG: UvrD-helicase domain-containing protein [Peptoniphilaceae bacterium]|nr:UvrD-helicase domain-containing protein [Peptoniphilaceae bacterium]MDY6019246.1 UvrD-helicase domain-containing protein [Anaerococcus sp.]
MTDFEYTKAQKEAIFTRDKNIIISAAAGSGKTRVLVDRVISLVINEKVDIDKMIIVTFTNKASVEMKDRIRQAFEDEMIKDGSDKIFLRKQIKLLKNSQIKTLHSFCSDMLREYFYLTDDLSPSFKVMNENQGAILKRDAIDEVFTDSYENMTDDFRTFLNNFSSSREDSVARDVIYKTYDFINSQVRPLQWLDKKTEEDLSLAYFIAYVKEKLKDLEEKALDLIKYSKEKNMRPNYQETFESDYKAFKNLSNMLKEDDSSSLEDFLKRSNISFSRMPGRSKVDDPAQKDYVKAQRDAYKKAYKEICSLCLNTDQKTLQVFNPIEKTVLKEINRLTKAFIKTYQRKKQENNYLDFTDMEHKFIKLLDKKEAVDKLKESYQYIFFDEYQDSNEIQNYIIEKLKRDNNLFFVGDVKQSIYGFRLAQPDLFLEKLESYQKDPLSKRIDLNENFRTDRDIIRFNNYIFDNLMTKEASDIDYKNGGHRLNPQKVFDKIENPKVEISILKKDLNAEEYMVKLIERIKSQGFAYKDIAILFRSSSKVYKYEQAFKAANIPFFSDISKVSFDAVEVEFFINILKYIENPRDDLTLLAVIRSNLFDFTEDDIAEIRLSSDEKNFFAAFDAYDKEGEILEKKINFQTIFLDFYHKLQTMSLYEFGNYIFEKTSYYKFLLARDRGEERIKNIEAFIDMMADYDQNNDNGLFGFLAYVTSLRSGQADNIQAARDLSENENLVRLMTIHKSKGLQFPVVILAEAERAFSKQNTRSPILFDKDLGIGINVSDYENKLRLSSIKRSLILEKSIINDTKEEMRVLYVALTRAIYKMYIVGKDDLSDKQIKKLQTTTDYLGLKSYMEWLISILMKDKIFEDITETYTSDCFSDGTLELKIIDKMDANKQSDFTNIYDFLNSKDYDKKEVEKLSSILDKPYPYQEDTLLSVKKSVTELSKNFKSEEEGYEKSDYDQVYRSLDYNKPDFLTEKKTYKAVDKGSIIHKVFQNLPLKSYTKDSIKNEIENLISQRKIGKDEIEIIENDKLIDFYNNPIIKDLSAESINIRKEESFLMKYQGIYVNGQIDLVFEKKNDLVLIDFKTDQIKREGFYDSQLLLYKKALEEALGKKVIESYIYWYNFREFSKIKTK